MKALRKLVRDQRGSSAVEFAVVGNVFLMVILAVCYLGIMLWHESHLNWAVDAASRLAAVDSTTTQTAIATAVNNYLTSVGMDTASVSYSVATVSGVKVGTINATLIETLTVPLFSTVHLTYTASAKIPQPSS
jgi:Flp pilus assembly protein TadG